MSKWIAEFDLEDGDTMPEHIDLEYKGVKIDFHCRPKEPILDELRAEIIELRSRQNVGVLECLDILDKYKAESEDV